MSSPSGEIAIRAPGTDVDDYMNAASSGTTENPKGALRRSSILAQIAWSLVGVLPFLSIYLVHFMGAEGIPTGFTAGDMPYYCANGRAIFERGNGFAGPNAYDPDPGAPNIYFHWLVWALGFGIAKLGISPGALFVGTGVVSALLCSWLTLRLVDKILPGREFERLLYLLTMWGGGVLCLAALAVNVFKGRPPLADLFAYDPFYGLWFLNWGRNLVYPTEATYHALMAAVFLAVVSGYPKLALLAAAGLAATHPFSGLQVLLIMFAWSGLTLALTFTRPGLARWLVTAAMLAVFLGYNLVFLESFEQHRALRKDWTLDWSLRTQTLPLAYGPVIVFAAWRVWHSWRAPRVDLLFFIVCFLVSFGLAKHDWILSKPVQPLHFTRGYVWLPLCLLGLPALQRLLVVLRARRAPVLLGAFVVAFFGLAILDNATFLAGACARKPGMYLQRSEQDTFTWMRQHGLKGVFLSSDRKTAYLAAVYTSVRPYYGHSFNTPDFRERQQRVEALFREGAAGPWLTGIDYVLVPNRNSLAFLDSGEWQRLYENEELVLFGRKSSGPRVW